MSYHFVARAVETTIVVIVALSFALLTARASAQQPPPTISNGVSDMSNGSIDSDNDGVSDVFDACCDTPYGLDVDVFGRPIGDVDDDCDVDLADFALLQRNLSGVLDLIGPCCQLSPEICDDGDPCTGDTCDLSIGACRNTPVMCPSGQICDSTTGECADGPCSFDSVCDDDLFCNGLETCNIALQICSPGINPCEPGYVCDEAFDVCVCGASIHTLTLAVDHLTGTECNDTFNAPLAFDPPSGRNIPTLQTGDVAQGGPGSDILNAKFNFTAVTTVDATLSDIETLNLTDVGTSKTSLDGTNFTGVENINVVDSTNSQTLNLLNLPALADVRMVNSQSLFLSFLPEAMSAADDELTLVVQGMTNGYFSFQRAGQGDTNVETVNVVSSGDAPNTLLALLTHEAGTIRFTGDQSIDVAVPLSGYVLTIDAAASQGGVSVSTAYATDSVDFTGSGFNDVFEGSAHADTFLLGGGNDLVRPGAGFDRGNVGAGSDILDLSDLISTLTSANRAIVSGMLISGTDYTPTNEIDAVRFGNVTTSGDLSDGASANEFQTEVNPGSKSVSLTEPVAVLELAWPFTPYLQLGGPLDGSALLGGLSSLMGPVPGQIDVGSNGRSVLIIAYQGPSGFIYLGDEDWYDSDTRLSASEISLVCIITDYVAIGGFEPSNFQ